MPTTDLADHAYGHCVAVLRSGAAETAATEGLRRGGRSLVGVLAHSRHQALTSAGAFEADPDDPVPADDLPALAWALAATRPPVERAVVDLETRHGLRRLGLGRSLGLSPAAAAARAAAVAAGWEADLDPALMAWMGPGDCEGLAEVLAGIGPGSTMGELLARAPAVSDHADGCDVCRDRRRAMVSVRALVAQTPLATAPASVRQGERRRLHRPAAPPPSIDPDPRRWLRRAALAGVAVAVLAGGTAAATTLGHRHGNGQAARVAALTKVPAGGSSLVLSPGSLPPTGGRLVITNRSSHPLQWQAQSDAAWLQLNPATGKLPAHASVAVVVTPLRSAPEGQVQAAVTVTAGDGSTAAAELAGDLERPPDLSAAIDACSVVATAEDEADIATVVLHWRDKAEQQAQMSENDQGYVAQLPPSPAPLTWWVTATDSRGNQARTPDAVLQPGAC